jgi:hypothetical protein
MSEFLRCDAAGCDHRENVETITESMIGKACPKCGANLLTASDYAAYAAHFRPAMELLEQLGIARPAAEGTVGAVSINYHDGELRMRLPTPTHTTERRSE